MFNRCLVAAFVLSFGLFSAPALSADACSVEVQVSDLKVTVSECLTGTTYTCVVNFSTADATYFAPSVVCPISESEINSGSFVVPVEAAPEEGTYRFEGVLVFAKGSKSELAEFDGSLTPAN